MKTAKYTLYILGALFILVPLCVVLFSSYSFSFENIRILAGVSFSFFIAGNILSAVCKKTLEKPLWPNLGLIAGLLVIFIFMALL